MKRAWVKFSAEPQRGFVGSHRWWSEPVGRKGRVALPPREWDPPVDLVPGRGYPRIFVEFEGFVFEFISTTEMRECAAVLAQPRLDPLTSQRRWYRKLPASVKARHARGRAAALLSRAATAYEKQLPNLRARTGEDGGVVYELRL